MTMVKFYKPIFSFNLFNLPIDYLHELISSLLIEFTSGVVAIVYVHSIRMYFCDIFPNGLLFTETTKGFNKIDLMLT